MKKTGFGYSYGKVYAVRRFYHLFFPFHVHVSEWFIHRKNIPFTQQWGEKVYRINRMAG
jgi:hypothetical protein